MILKKPYAFILKHFRLIHLLLLIPMIYLITKTKVMVDFFAEYVANGNMVSGEYVLSNLSANFINILMYVAVLIILFVFVFVSYVLQKKSKPTKYYNVCIIYYILIFILITASFNIFNMIENDTLSNIFGRLIRDLSYIVYYSQYIFVIFNLIRGIGFNIKHFNFKSDLQNMEITSEDSEEFEFLVGMNSYKTKRNIRRFFREFKYYFKENRFIFIIIFIILLVSIGSYAFVNRNVYKREYNENDSLAAGYINFKIKDSYISSLSLNGDVINNDKSYVIIQIELTNRYREDKEFNFGDLELVINKKYISPNISLGNYFKDFGLPFSGSLVKGNTSGTYILVYEIDKYLIYNSLAIETYSSFDNTSGGLGVLSKKINIKPTIINNTVITNNVGRGTNIDLSNTNLNKTTASILDHILINRYEYNYNYCLSNGECYNSVDAFTSSYDKTLLVLNYTLSLDSESTYMYSNKSYKTFFEDFMKIKYVLNNKNYYLNVKLKNNANYDKKLVIEVPSELNDASSIEAVITVRNLSYAIKLK